MGAQPSWVWWRPPEAGSPKILVQDTAIGGWPVCGVVMPYAESDPYSPGRLAGFRPPKAGSVTDAFLKPEEKKETIQWCRRSESN